MKRRKQPRLSKRVSPLLLFLIGGTVILLTGGSFFYHSLTQAGGRIDNSDNIPNQQANNVLSIQPHQAPISHKTTPSAGTSSTSPTPTRTNSSTPTANAGTTLPPGSVLPGEQACAARVALSSSEPRPDNYTANHSVPTAAQIANLQAWNPSIGMDVNSDTLRKQITGNYTGTTDEILQWVACKWGIDVNIVRAQAVSESNWRQSQLGDYTTDQSYCPPGKWDGSGCYQSYGILQIKYYYFKTEWPMMQQDTAFNAEFAYGWIRNCYEGWTDYLYQETPSAGYPGYHAGDIWGCLGFWYSGGWYTPGAIQYIQVAQQHYQQKPWLQSSF